MSSEIRIITHGPIEECNECEGRGIRPCPMCAGGEFYERHDGVCPYCVLGDMACYCANANRVEIKNGRLGIIEPPTGS